MTPLERRIEKSYKLVQRKAEAIFQSYAQEIGKDIELASRDVIGIVAANISSFESVNYLKLNSSGILTRIQRQVNSRLELLADKISERWTEARKTYDILSRVSMAYIGRKASPPWSETKLNLKDSLRFAKDGGSDPRKGRIHSLMARLTDQIVDEVRRGALVEESSQAIVSRIRGMFQRSSLNEAEKKVQVKQVTMKKENVTTKIDEGVYSEDDLKDMIQRSIVANKWEYRQYRPWFSDTLKRRNRIMRDLEQGLMTDAVSMLHSGELQIGPEQMGVQDFMWKTNKQETTCEVCGKRNEKTMKWIRANMKDKFRDMVPPLHPNCNCELIPIVSDEWPEKVLSDGDLEWDSNDGAVYKADKLERRLGVKDMTFDEYMSEFLE